MGRTSLYHDGLARGLHEAVKALDRTEAQLCVLSDSIDQAPYKKLVTALCQDHKIHLISAANSILLVSGPDSASTTPRAPPSRSLAALASLSSSGVRRPPPGSSSSTTSRPRLKWFLNQDTLSRHSQL